MKEVRNPYACAFCDVSFCTANTLVGHVQTNHVSTKHIEVDISKKKSSLLDKNLSKDFEFQNLEHSNVNGNVKGMVLEDEKTFMTLNKNNNSNNVNHSIPSKKSTKTSVVIDLNEKTLESPMTNKDQDSTHKAISHHSSRNDTKVDKIIQKQKQESQNNHFPCQICDKRFKNVKLLNAHIKLHNEKTQKCELCFKKFHLIATLQRHQRVHTG